ncbi:DUF1302 domain-containing protein [Simplicispira psychrophila]|uniref:DUF1302 domain-containing protein n=1 Tax=Simplicispira psychrophila TaxID=80882 RepID=UPI000561B06B|nr:DUF1302 family protein [Simplicispira psychrophila]
MKKEKSALTKASPIALAAALLCAAGAASAGESIEFGDGYKLDWRLNTNYTLSQRTKSAAPLLANNAAGNDGDNNFSKNALTANRLSALFEGKLSKGESGLVLSASTFYDDVYHRSNDNPGLGVSKPGRVDEFSADAKRFHGGYSRILDAYAYTSFEFGDSRRATIRVGRQAVNWGEAVYFPNIAQAQGPFDGTKSGVPGTETKDVILPEDQIAASVEITPRWTMLGQVQFGFHETIAPAPGTFLNSSDGVGPGGSCLGVYNGGNTCLGFARKDDITPGKTGQWGIGTRYRVTDQTEAGLYYLNYNDRTPLPIIQPAPPTYRMGSYQVRYFDDVKLLGGTVSTTFGNTSAYGEMTYRKGVPLLMGALATPERANATQINVGTFTNIGRSPIADSMQLLGEVSAVKYSGYEGKKSDLNFKTDSGLAFSGTLVLGYPGVFEGWDLTVPISYSQQLSGRTLLGGVGGKGDKRYSIGATFVRRGNMSVNVTYLGYLGSASLDAVNYRPLADRDQLALNLKYSF